MLDDCIGVMRSTHLVLLGALGAILVLALQSDPANNYRGALNELRLIQNVDIDYFLRRKDDLVYTSAFNKYFVSKVFDAILDSRKVGNWTQVNPPINPPEEAEARTMAEINREMREVAHEWAYGCVDYSDFYKRLAAEFDALPEEVRTSPATYEIKITQGFFLDLRRMARYLILIRSEVDGKPSTLLTDRFMGSVELQKDKVGESLHAIVSHIVVQCGEEDPSSSCWSPSVVLFPRLRSVWHEISTATVPEAQSILMERLATISSTVSFLGMTVDTGSAGIAAPALVFLVLLYFAAHLRQAISLAEAHRSTGGSVAWFCIYDDSLSRLLSFVSLAVAPVACLIALLTRVHGWSNVLGRVGLGLTLLVGLVGVYCAVRIHCLRKGMAALPSSESMREHEE